MCNGFHFIPGSDANHQWVTTRNNARARKLVMLASNDLLQLGIALHGLQDTFSHEGFSGWREDINSCYDWYYVKSVIPNVGHAELRVIPDVVNYVWTDPRSGNKIDNKRRTMSATKATYDFLKKFFNPNTDQTTWKNLQEELQKAFKIESYDKRKQKFCDLSTILYIIGINGSQIINFIISAISLSSIDAKYAIKNKINIDNIEN